MNQSSIGQTVMFATNRVFKFFREIKSNMNWILNTNLYVGKYFAAHITN